MVSLTGRCILGGMALAAWMHLRDQPRLISVSAKHTRRLNGKVSTAPVFILPQLRIAINGSEMRLSPMSNLASKEQAAIIGEALKYIQTRKKTTGNIDEPVKSQKQDGFENSTSYGAQISRSEANLI